MSYFNSSEPLLDGDLQSMLPPGYRVEFVTRSSAWLSDTGWMILTPDIDCDDQYAIQVRAKNNRIMAAFGWHRKPRGLVATVGTWVSPALRGRGLARQLWRTMVKLDSPKKIESHTISRAGLKLAEYMKAELAGEIKVGIEDSSWIDDESESPDDLKGRVA